MLGLFVVVDIVLAAASATLWTVGYNVGITLADFGTQDIILNCFLETQVPECSVCPTIC